MEENVYIKNKIKWFNLFWLFFMVELIVFFLVTYYIIAPEELEQSRVDSHIALLYVTYLLTIISIPGIYGIYNKKKKRIKPSDSEKLKLDSYMFSILIKYAVLEVVALLALLAFYLNEIKEPLYMFGIIFVTALLNKPTLKQYINDFSEKIDENAAEEIVYMPDEIKQFSDQEENNPEENNKPEEK